MIDTRIFVFVQLWKLSLSNVDHLDGSPVSEQ